MEVSIISHRIKRVHDVEDDVLDATGKHDEVKLFVCAESEEAVEVMTKREGVIVHNSLELSTIDAVFEDQSHRGIQPIVHLHLLLVKG